MRGGEVQNMTTAASLWMAAGAGIAAGAGQFALVVIGAALALLLLLLATISARITAGRRTSRQAEPEDTHPPSRRGVTQD